MLKKFKVKIIKVKKNLNPKYFWVQKNYGLKNIWGPNKFGTEMNLVSKRVQKEKNLGPK